MPISSPWPGSLDDALMITDPRTDGPARVSMRGRTPPFEVRARWPVASAGRSLSIPTWFYGHEPTNVFATEIAKYFSMHCARTRCSITAEAESVYLPGQAGTVQEIFQAVTENFYAADASLVVPLILVGREYWTDVYPAWPLCSWLRSPGE